uniref:Palmitoyltransferase n=2 Tax=Guillardia theta TaxID=55529 RepID=A0A7S4JGU6_GUITH|mmetsp:Transcript_16274/g.54536  ORF Transcript_16274/g.54536 Transcript_16274/m.54536 type:complete len:128 (+) Transcript_16274:596-979(+)
MIICLFLLFSNLGSILSWLSCIFLLLTIIFVWHLLVDQIRLISRNLTLNERFFSERYEYLADSNGMFYNPFDQGMVKNWIEFLGCGERRWLKDHVYTTETLSSTTGDPENSQGMPSGYEETSLVNGL